MIAEAVTWPAVALALIAAAPGLLAAYYSRDNHKQLMTTNDKTVGTMVSEVHGEASHEGTPFPTHGPPGPPPGG